MFVLAIIFKLYRDTMPCLSTCADPGIFVGGEEPEVNVHLTEKKTLTTFIFLLFIPPLILQRGSNG